MTGQIVAGARAALAVLAAATLGGCSIEDTPPGGFVVERPAVLTVVSGDKQTARIGTEIGDIVVRVENGKSQPVPNAMVVFAVTVGEGRLASEGRPTTTDGQGYARDRWTLGLEPGPQELEVRVIEPATGQIRLTAKVTATATAS